ncbi:PilZ domain-containing protein [Cohnella thermotolerans]|uniref:PilZ domain-containing protein n=1 Tax=Cohnella thermotolerans TaxID=329858 RepID=UPI00047E267C|nr:PilZ domain-containing protein [Cohnella thermotolerans]
MSDMEDHQAMYPRKFVRMGLHEGVIAEMKVLRVNGCRVNSNQGKVVIADISPGGLKFTTMLRLDLSAVWRVWFQFMLEGETLRLIGSVRWGREDENGWWNYGVELDSDPVMQSNVIGVLNRRLLRLYPDKLIHHQIYKMQGELEGLRVYPPSGDQA